MTNTMTITFLSQNFVNRVRWKFQDAAFYSAFSQALTVREKQKLFHVEKVLPPHSKNYLTLAELYAKAATRSGRDADFIACIPPEAHVGDMPRALKKASAPTFARLCEQAGAGMTRIGL